MKTYLYIILILVCCTFVNAQTYRIATKQDGIAKIPLSQIAHSNTDALHLFHNGSEVAIYCDADDIYFLGKMQHGDSSYYDDYTTEAVFYLKSDEQMLAKRYATLQEADAVSNGVDAVNMKLHFEKDSLYFMGYNEHNFERTVFEGFYWRTLRDYPGNNINPIYIVNAQLKYTFQYYPTDTTDLRLCFSTYIDSSGGATKFSIKRKLYTILNGDTIGIAAFDTLADHHVATYKVPSSAFQQGENAIEFLNITDDTLESRIAIDYFELEGNAKAFATKSNATFACNIADKSQLTLTDFATASIVAIDTLSNSIVFKNTPSINLLPAQYYFVITDTIGIETANVSLVNETSYHDTTNAADMIIIYHSAFKQQAMEYAQYRSSKGVRIQTADIEDVYKEFSDGRKRPAAIKAFLRYAHQNWQEPSVRYAMLIGDASLDARQVLLTSTSIDYIPTYGNPPTDYWFGCFKDDATHSADVVLGRIPCETPQQMDNYIAKVKQYEAMTPAQWHKHFLFINGGYTDYEKTLIRNDAATFGSYVWHTPLCADTQMINKDWEDMNVITEAKKNEIIAAVNNGAMFAIFNGHGAPSGFDMSGWQVDNLNNKDKYGILMSMSCNTGAFAETTAPSINEDYLLKYADKGFVAALGSTTTVTIGSNYAFMNGFVSNLISADNPLRRLGDLMEAAKRALNYSTGNQYVNVMRYNFSLLGDPMLEIKIAPTPDVYINADDAVVVQNDVADTMFITIPVHSAGTSFDEPFNNRLQHSYNGENTDYYAPLGYIQRSTDITFAIPIAEKSGVHTISIFADCDNDIKEYDESNNVATLQFYVAGDSTDVAILAIDQASSGFNPTNVLRGDTAILVVVVENVSAEITSEPTYLYIANDSISLPSLSPMSSYIVEYKVETENLGYVNYFNVWLVPSMKETFMLTIYDDTTKPELLVFADDSELHDKDYIISTPEIDITLMDNSLLPVLSSNPISVRFNGIPLSETNTQAYALTAFPGGLHTKATLKLKLEEVTDRENYLQITGRDANGNVVTANYYLYISLNNEISDFIAYPIPTIGNDITFSYYLATRLEQLEQELEIYDRLGKHIRTLTSPAKVRNNYILWDMKDTYGNIVATGTYYCRLNIKSELWTAPQYIKVIIKR
ncbi:MAG: C25 family cysteine peptidase [Ignavibacteria bacterium]|jgi:hypothetical protein|nr:C25 family cysteine peptidase [Ignavibacteria bacterium]